MKPVLEPGWVFDPLLPLPLIGLLGAGLAALMVWHYAASVPHLGRIRTGLLLLLRLAGIALLLLILTQPSRIERLPPPPQNRTTLVGLDTSLSMRQADAGASSRLDAARELLLESGLVTPGGSAATADVRFYEFHEDAKPVTASLIDLKPTGATTRLHTSILTLLQSVPSQEAPQALLLLTDGHDFELVNPATTGAAARQRQIPIYAVPFGRQGKVRDVSARIHSYQPYTYVKQKARILASLRLIGCELEDLTVQLFRHNQLVQTRKVNAADFSELPVEFEVAEPAVGQYVYEVRVQPLAEEADLGNNVALTYLNVIDQHIRVLLLEGSPYWDTTFLQRSLMENDKFDLEVHMRVSRDKVHRARKQGQKQPGSAPLVLPETADEFARYDVVLLGRHVETLITQRQLEALTGYVMERGGTVIFSRGPAFEGELAGNTLEPVLWSEPLKERVRLTTSRENQSSNPLRTVAGERGGFEGLPELLAGREPGERKPLTSALAQIEGDDGSPIPAVVHRRMGSGQVVSIGVEGLWRWGFHARMEGTHTAFDRFWDQMVLWLLAGRELAPGKSYSFRPSAANILLGESVFFRLMARTPDAAPKAVPVRLLLGDAEVARVSMVSSGEDTRMTAEYKPEKPGQYRAVAALPDGTVEEARFMVYTSNLEESEVATDVALLKRLCESSGGRLLAPADLPALLAQLRSEAGDRTPKTRRVSAWDTTWFFYLIGVLFAIEWHLRRRWGLS